MARATAASSTAPQASRSICSSIVPLDDPIKISRLTVAQCVDGRAPPVRHSLCGVGARDVPRRVRRPSSTTEIDAATRAMFARNPWNAAFGGARRLRRSGGAAERLDRRPARIPRPQRDARGTGSASAAKAAVGRHRARASIPARRCRRRRSRTGRVRSKSSCSSVKPRSADAARSCSRATAKPISTRVLADVDGALGRPARHGPGQDAGPCAWTSC